MDHGGDRQGFRTGRQGWQRPQGNRVGGAPHSRRLCVGPCQSGAHHDLPARRSRQLPLFARRDLVRPRDGVLRGTGCGVQFLRRLCAGRFLGTACLRSPRVEFFPPRGRRNGRLYRLRDGAQSRQPDAAVGETFEKGLSQGGVRCHARPLRGDADGHDQGSGCRRLRAAVSLAADVVRSRRYGVRQRTCHGHAADRFLAGGAGEPCGGRRSGDSVVRRRRCRHVVSYADLLLDRSRARMSERKQRVDVEVFPHVDVLALQSRYEFRLPALRPHVEGFAGGSRSVGESGARRGARGHGRGAEARRGGAREVRDRLFGDDGPDLVRSVEADGRIFAGEVYRRQCEGRDRTRQIQG